MNEYDFDRNEKYDIVSICGYPYMFTNLRIKRDTIPGGMTAYDVMDADCDGCFHRVEKHIVVNHWGTIIGFDRIGEAETAGGYVCREPDGGFLDDSLTESGYRQEYGKLLEETSKEKEKADRYRKILAAKDTEKLIDEMFGIEEDVKDEEVSFDMLLREVKNSPESEEIRNRLTKDTSDAYYGYFEALKDYLSAKNDEWMGELDEDTDMKELGKKLDEAKDELRRIFSKGRSGGRQYRKKGEN